MTQQPETKPIVDRAAFLKLLMDAAPKPVAKPKPAPKPKKAADPDYYKMKGAVVVFTGKLSAMTRADAQDHLKTMGGRSGSAISGSTDYLVVGETDATTTSKLEKAKKHNVKLLNDKQWMEILKHHKLV